MNKKLISRFACLGAAVGLIAVTPGQVIAAEDFKPPVGKITQRAAPAKGAPSSGTKAPAASAAPTSGQEIARARPAAVAPDRGLSITSGATLNSQLIRVRTSGGTGALNFRLLDTSGKPAELPAGLVFGSDGSLSGAAPSVASPKTLTYLIQVEDSGGGKASRTVQLTINPPLNVEGGSIQATAGGRIKSPVKFINVSGGTGNYAVSYSNPDGSAMRIPSGLVLDGSGRVSGAVPKSLEKMAGLTATISDEGGARVSIPVDFNLAPALEVSTLPIELTAGATMPSAVPVVNATGGSGAVRYTLFDKDGTTPARLPEGLKFDEATGTLRGLVPPTPQEGRYVVLAQDAGGGEASARFEWKINPQLQISFE